MAVWNTTLIGLAAGVGGTGAGGLYVFILKNVRMHKMSAILGFSGGIMLVAVFLELLPEALMLSGLICTMIGIIIGIMFLMASEGMIESIKHTNNKAEKKFSNTGLLLFFAITCHNFPEGLAIGSGYAASDSLGILLAMAIAIHNVPEGMAVATAFRLSGMTPVRAFLYSALAGVPMGLGALAGQALGEISPLLITVSLGFAAGAMLYTTCEEILPDIFMTKDATPSGFFLGLVVGIVLFNIF